MNNYAQIHQKNSTSQCPLFENDCCYLVFYVKNNFLSSQNVYILPYPEYFISYAVIATMKKPVTESGFRRHHSKAKGK